MCVHFFLNLLHLCSPLLFLLRDLLFAFFLFLFFLFCKWIAQDKHQSTDNTTKQHDQQHTSPPHLYPSRTMFVPEYPSIKQPVTKNCEAESQKEQLKKKFKEQHIRQRCFNNADDDDESQHCKNNVRFSSYQDSLMLRYFGFFNSTFNDTNPVLPVT